jgi:hypothetical protein
MCHFVWQNILLMGGYLNSEASMLFLSTLKLNLDGKSFALLQKKAHDSKRKNVAKKMHFSKKKK